MFDGSLSGQVADVYSHLHRSAHFHPRNLVARKNYTKLRETLRLLSGCLPRSMGLQPKPSTTAQKHHLHRYSHSRVRAFMTADQQNAAGAQKKAREVQGLRGQSGEAAVRERARHAFVTLPEMFEIAGAGEGRRRRVDLLKAHAPGP